MLRACAQSNPFFAAAIFFFIKHSAPVLEMSEKRQGRVRAGIAGSLHTSLTPYPLPTTSYYKETTDDPSQDSETQVLDKSLRCGQKLPIVQTAIHTL